MKTSLTLLTLLMSMGIWTEDCFEGSPITIDGKIVVRQIEGMPDLDAETGIFTSGGWIPIYLLETKDSVCFSTHGGNISNSDTNQIQLVLEDNQEAEFKSLVDKRVTLSVENYFEGLTRYYIRTVAFSDIELLTEEALN